MCVWHGGEGGCTILCQSVPLGKLQIPLINCVSNKPFCLYISHHLLLFSSSSPENTTKNPQLTHYFCIVLKTVFVKIECSVNQFIMQSAEIGLRDQGLGIEPPHWSAHHIDANISYFKNPLVPSTLGWSSHNVFHRMHFHLFPPVLRCNKIPERKFNPFHQWILLLLSEINRQSLGFYWSELKNENTHQAWQQKRHGDSRSRPSFHCLPFLQLDQGVEPSDH